ncbi:uncharacterized protein J7T54_004067 [Emericellopsis cladophorae]|uniref:Protein PBDC1 homolog n=1 Tax=Emericellopsis cladophorae TaxID=2686198 RepID=A0A9Q0BEJ2_9HYPO|nr:uncharacterized protein J7T54_004067 [Emericellopsis cladophorae]KAI6781294.1 hypothetical protein J7T54_004067 [Emericellopsis cladophorae]
MDPMEQMANGPSGPLPKDFNPEEAGNSEDMEKQFAVKVVQHMSTYWSILERVRGSSLRLTKLDDEIYTHLMLTFPDFDPAATINEDEMKSKAGKEKWRPFMMAYEKRVDDYNFGTMVRNHPGKEYDQDTTIFVPRMQFYAIEIARNKKGLNDWIFEKAEKERQAK